MSVGLTRHAPLRNPVGHICTGDQPLISDRAVFSPLVIRRSFAISPDIRLRPSRPRRYFPSFDRKRPITSMTTCGIVDHHDPFPRIFPPCSNPLPCLHQPRKNPSTRWISRRDLFQHRHRRLHDRCQSRGIVMQSSFEDVPRRGLCARFVADGTSFHSSRIERRGGNELRAIHASVTFYIARSSLQ